MFAGQAAAKRVGAPGINLKNTNLPEGSRAFIRCNGPGYSVHIRKDTSVLYKVMSIILYYYVPAINFMIMIIILINNKDPKIPPNLTPVNLEDFYRFEVPKTCELRKFVEQKLQNLHLNIAYKKGNAYFEFTCATEDIEKNKEVLLMDKVAIMDN